MIQDIIQREEVRHPFRRVVTSMNINQLQAGRMIECHTWTASVKTQRRVAVMQWPLAGSVHVLEEPSETSPDRKQLASWPAVSARIMRLVDCTASTGML